MIDQASFGATHHGHGRFLRKRRILVGLTLIAIGLSCMTPTYVCAKVDLVTLPEREQVQLTIYNSADLTLVREIRRLTLRKGDNKLQFGWANTLIDPTSVDLRALNRPEAVKLLDVSYPPRAKGVAVWNVTSEIAGEEPVEITFFTSGLSWSAFYLGTLSSDEKQIKLEGYVRVNNQSGEDYDKARTRLLVGKINLVDRIMDLARRQFPYGAPIHIARAPEAPAAAKAQLRVAEERVQKAVAAADLKPKEIVKEGLAEYFLFTIEGEETIPHGWAKRLPSFERDGIPVVNLYRFEEERWNDRVMRFIGFANDEAHGLGEEPLPGGSVKVFRRLDIEGHLSYVGASRTKYIPKGEKIELPLGEARNVRVEPKLMRFRTDHYLFDSKGDIEGWDEIRTVRVEVMNYRPLPIKVEIWRNFPSKTWDLDHEGDFGELEKVDVDTVKYTLSLPPYSKKAFTYRLTTHHGKRAQ